VTYNKAARSGCVCTVSRDVLDGLKVEPLQTLTMFGPTENKPVYLRKGKLTMTDNNPSYYAQNRESIYITEAMSADEQFHSMLSFRMYDAALQFCKKNGKDRYYWDLFGQTAMENLRFDYGIYTRSLEIFIQNNSL